MFEQQMSQSIEAGAPDITYSGNEGPKSPQQEQQMMMAQLEQEYSRYVFEMEEQGIQPMTLRQFIEQAMAEGQMSSAQPMAPRQMAAYGGIMGLDGRRQYGFGSSLKKFVRKIIPNEVSELAVKAAPFVAPFNAPLAGLMAGVGSFDQTGRIGSSLKAGLGTYAQGKIMSGIGGGGYQGGKTMNPFTTSNWTSPIGTQSGIGKLFKGGKFNNPFATTPKDMSKFNELGLGGSDPSGIAGAAETAQAGLTGDAAQFESIMGNPSTQIAKQGFTQAPKGFLGQTVDKVMEYVPTSFSDLKNPKKLLGAAGILTLGTKLLGGGPEETIDTIMSRGEGYDMDDIRTRVTAAFKDPSGKLLQDLRIEFPYLGTKESKNLDAMAMGGRAGYMGGGMTMGDPRMMMPQSRMPAAEGGIMDLGGMEKDYRAEGGFVPIGREEKADDVPARLSVNEFVMTADAVRGMGDGDIDLGAKRMENLMSSMENKKGAQQMFDVSERLSEVV